MVDILTGLFDTSGFPARWNCGVWSSELGWLHIYSDLAIWAAYTAIRLPTERHCGITPRRQLPTYES